MPFVSTGHIWLILILLVVVLIIWGPGKLPDVGSGLGRAIREFRKASNDTREEFSKATRVDHEPAAPAASAAATPAEAPAASAAQTPARAVEPTLPRDPAAPAVPAMPAPGVAPFPAPVGTGSVLGGPPENERT